MKYTLILLLTSIIFTSCGQEHHADFLRYVDEQNAHFADLDESPLGEKASHFKALEYYPFQAEYLVPATWTAQDGHQPFEMATSTERKPMYVKMGEFQFVIHDTTCTLSAYQNIDYVRGDPEAANDLFIPFNDLTNGVTSYGGGRYMDVKIPGSTATTLDFNQTYNPYCAYDHHYSCPIPPDENVLDVTIGAGVMLGWQRR